MSDKEHWDAVYSSRRPTELSWFQPQLERSLGFIDGLQLAPDAAIIDVGGGASTLVDDLLKRGFEQVTVVDLSSAALEASKARLGATATRASWLACDATETTFDRASVDLWHDRAVFHFLTETSARVAYVDGVHHSVKPGGHLLVATFSPGGPEKCSGLPVVRYSPQQLADTFGPAFELVDSESEIHATPGGGSQSFSYVLLRRRSGSSSS